MAKRTVYLPVEIETKEEISEADAISVAEMMKYMIDDGFFCSDNMFDTEVKIENYHVKFPVTKESLQKIPTVE